MNKVTDGKEEGKQVPKPPKKPLSPYMKYCKSIWKEVKGNNPSMSICQAGSSIGKLWREMSDVDRKTYMDSFTKEKAEYEIALQEYLKVTGLSLSDIAKVKSSKKSSSSKTRVPTMTTISPLMGKSTTVNTTSPSVVTSNVLPGGNCVTVTSLSSLPHIGQMLNVQSVGGVTLNSTAMLNAGVSNALTYNPNSHRSLSNEMGVPNASTPAEYETDYEEQNEDVLDCGGQELAALAAFNTTATLLEDDIEDGEVVKNSRRIAHFYESIASRVFDAETTKHQTASAHNVFNSYAYNPWVNLQQNCKLGTASIFNQDLMLQTEITHLQSSLIDKTNEAEELTERLRLAQNSIQELKQELNCLGISHVSLVLDSKERGF